MKSKCPCPPGWAVPSDKLSDILLVDSRVKPVWSGCGGCRRFLISAVPSDKLSDIVAAPCRERLWPFRGMLLHPAEFLGEKAACPEFAGKYPKNFRLYCGTVITVPYGFQ